MKNLRGYIIGGIVGGLIVFSSQALAESTSLVGKKILAEHVVVVDGTELPVKAINIGGSTFGPIRAISDAVGKDIEFKNGTVYLKSKEEPIIPDISEINKPRTEVEITDIIDKESDKLIATGNYTLENIDNYISSQEGTIAFREKQVSEMTFKTAEEEAMWKRKVEDLKIGLEIYKAVKSKLQSQQQ